MLIWDGWKYQEEILASYIIKEPMSV